jgi:cytochrome P450
MRINGELLGDEDLIKILMQLLAGGIDSTAALLANVFVHLDDRPDDRPRLRDDDALLKRATEEFVRYFTPIQSVARTATCPVQVAGEEFAAREPVMLSMASMNRDEAVFDDPDKVVLDRWPNPHVGFGLGMHRCLGSNFARMMFQVALSAILRRLPDYRIDRARAVPYRSKAQINGWVSIPATFSPSHRVTPAPRAVTLDVSEEEESRS